MTSSIVTTVGSATQAAYCAATSFQDYFARWRLSQGFPAQAFAFGLVLEVGTVISQPQLRKTLIRNGIYGTSEADFLKLIEASFVPQSLDPTLGNDPYAQAYLLTGLEAGKLVDMYERGLVSDYYWPADPRHSGLMQTIEDLATRGPKAKEVRNGTRDLNNASPAEVKRLVTAQIVERLAKLLFMATSEIDPERGVSYYGMDSMIAAELRSWLWKTFALDISFLELSSPNLRIQSLVDRVLVVENTAANTAPE